MEILPIHVAWRPASPSSKGRNPPETHQSGSEQFEDVAGGVGVVVPEVCLASPVSTAQDAPGSLEFDLLLASFGFRNFRISAISAPQINLVNNLEDELIPLTVRPKCIYTGSYPSYLYVLS
jgi:hypothetical protein